MLLPVETAPKNSLFYIGGILLKELKQNSDREFFSVYRNLKKQYKISFKSYILVLNWLFLIDAIEVNEKGVLMYASEKTNY